MTERATEFVVTLAQLNPTVGDIDGNAAKARAARERAKADGADLVVLSELFLTGYPPEDLVLKPAFQAACRAATEALARETADGGPAMLIGTPWVDEGKLYNAFALLDGGAYRCAALQGRTCRTTACSTRSACSRAGPLPGPVIVRGIRRRRSDLRGHLARESEDTRTSWSAWPRPGAEIMIVPNGSPYARDKHDVRLSIAVARVTESGLPLIYVNQIGGQDELVFDGASFALNADLSAGGPIAGLCRERS